MIHVKTGKTYNTIGLDAIALPSHFSGAAHYILYLIRAILTTERPFRCIVFCRETHRHLFEPWLSQGDRVITLTISNRWQKMRSYEKVLPSLLDEHKIGLFHAMHYVTPPAGKNRCQITTFHDLGFIERPADYPLIKRWYFKKHFPRYLNQADAVICVSDSTRRAMAGYFPKQARNAWVVYPGTDHFDSSVPLPSRDMPFILSVNTFERRKNIPLLVKSYNRFRKITKLSYRLILVGQRSNDFGRVQRLVRNSPYAKDIQIMTDIADRKIKNLYADAQLFISCSKYEGFGFTPFEALQAGCPVIIRENSITREIFNVSEHILSSDDPQVWAEKMSDTLSGQKNFSAMTRAIAHLTWKNTAIQSIKIYESLLERMPVATS